MKEQITCLAERFAFKGQLTTEYYTVSGAHYLEPPSPILTLGVNPCPYIFIFRTDPLRFLPGVFAPLHQLLHCDLLLLHKRCDLQNNNGEKRGGEFAQHAVHRTNNVFAGNMFLKKKKKKKKKRERVDSRI